MRVLRPLDVDVDTKLVDQLLREEYELERERLGRMLRGEETGSRY